MTSKKPKQAEDEEEMVDSQNESGEESDSSEDNDNSGMQEEIQVDFEGRNPDDGDADGIRQLLKQLFLKSHVDVNAMANLIISQHGIGSCLKQAWDENMQEDDSDDEADDNVVFGIASVINLSSTKNEVLAKPIKNLIIEKCKECASNTDVTVVENIFGSASDKSIGFIINERYVNIPPQVSVPLLDNLQKEISRAVEKKKEFKFDYYVLISKYHQSKKGKGDEEFYTNAEEELFAKEALCKFNYSVASEMDTGLTGKWKEEDEQLEPMRRVVILEASKLERIIESINGFLTGSA